MQSAGDEASATVTEGESVGNLADSGSEIHRAVPYVSLAAQDGDTPAQAISIHGVGQGAGANDGAHPVHQLAAHAHQGPLGALVQTHNHHQMMHLMAQQQMMLSPMHPQQQQQQHMQMQMQMLAAHLQAANSAAAQHAAPFAVTQQGFSAGVQQGGISGPGSQQGSSSEADSAEMIAKREVGRFRQVKSKKDACPLEWWRDKGSVARERGGGVVWGWLSKLARRALAMPATSAAAERLFSQASSAFQASRKRIKVVNSLLMLFLHQVPRSRTRIEYA